MHIKSQIKKMLTAVVIGIGAGFFCMLFRQKQLLLQTGFLDSYTLSPIKYLEVDGQVLLGYVLKQRLLSSLLLSVLATTYLGIVVSYFYMTGVGIAWGLLLAGAILRYGLKGILLIVMSMIPHQLILFPCFLVLTNVCCSLCKFLYFQDIGSGFNAGQKKTTLLKHIILLVVCNVVVIIGCYIESYVNPQLLKVVLKLF